jgi:hypothetical protein
MPLGLFPGGASDGQHRRIRVADHVFVFEPWTRNTRHPPGGFTEQTARYVDGQQKSVTGTAVIPQYFIYSVNDDGTRVAEVRLSRPDSPVYERTTTDLLGRTIKVERPGFGGGVQVTETHYNAKGQVERTSTTGLADTLYEYDEL